MVSRKEPPKKDQQLRFMQNDDGSRSRTRPTTVVKRAVEVLADLQWDESITAVKMAPSFQDFEHYREAVADRAFVQSSYTTRWRYTSYFIKWFLPGLSLEEPVIITWKAFRDDSVLKDVMRWQYVTSNPIVSDFVDGPFSSVQPGQAVDEVLNSYLIARQGSLRDKTRNRIRANLRKVGLLLAQKKQHHRVTPEVSPESVAVIVAWLFARQSQVVSWQTLVSDPWWKRLGIADESTLRSKLKEAAESGLLARFGQMDTLDQITTRYSLHELEAGMVGRS